MLSFIMLNVIVLVLITLSATILNDISISIIMSDVKVDNIDQNGNW